MKRDKSKNKLYKEYWIAKGYSEEEAIKKAKYENHICNPMSKEYWIAKGYSEEEATFEICKRNPTTKEYWIAKGYSEEETTFEIRKRKIICKEYWIAKGYSEEEAIKKAKDHAKNGNSSCKEYWIAKGYSEEEAIKKAKSIAFKAAHKKFTRQQNRFCKEYWIAKGYSEEEAIKKAKEENKNTTKNVSYKTRRTAGLAAHNTLVKNGKFKLINKKISEILKKKNKTHSPIFKEYWIAKGYSEEEAIKLVRETKFLNSSSLSRSSKIELAFFDEFEKISNIIVNRQKWMHINDHNYCADGRINNIIIEFNGTNFHLDSRFFNESQTNPVGVSYIDIHKKDDKKINDYLSKEYNVIIVWEYDYLNHKNELFNLLINKIKEINESNKKGIYWNSSSFFNKC